MALSPQTFLKEIDMTSRVPSPPGVAAAIAIQSSKGPWDPNGGTNGTGLGIPTLVTSDTEFVKIYGEPVFGCDIGYYVALTYLKFSNKLWVVRVGTSALEYSWNRQEDDAWGAESDITDGLTGAQMDPYTFSVEGRQVVLYAKNPGTWGSNISVQIEVDDTMPGSSTLGVCRKSDQITPTDSHKLTVWLGAAGSEVLFETFYVSADPNAVDGRGASAFIENVLLASEYIICEIDSAWGITVSNDWKTNGSSATEGLANTSGYIRIWEGEDETFGTFAARAAAMILAIDIFDNTDDYDVAIFLGGGWGSVLTDAGAGTYNASVGAKMAEVAAGRNDSVALWTCAYESGSAYSFISTTSGQVSFYNDTVNSINEVGTYETFAAMFAQWVEIFDEYTGRYIWIPCEGFVAGTIATNDRTLDRWWSFAGWQRGKLSVRQVSRRLNLAQRDILYGVNLNCIRQKRGKGIALWGDRSLQIRPTALSSLITRLLLNELEPVMAEALDNINFEFNDFETRLEVETIIDAEMASYKARRGVYEYLVKCDGDNNTPAIIDSQTLEVWLFIKPIRNINYIQFKVVLTRTGANLQALAETISI